MTFSSLQFLLFFIAVYLLVFFFKKLRARHIILLIASYIFYAYSDWRFIFLMLALTLINYFCALGIDSAGEKAHKRKLCVAVSVIASLVILGFFKYFNFFAENIRIVFGIKHSLALSILLPVGISFYTFQSMSYAIDVYRKKLPASRDFVKLALYISFFPQLVAGPIVRAVDFLPQLEKNTEITTDKLKEGVQIFLFGMFKKIVIADNISILVQDVFNSPNEFCSLTIWLAVLAYSVQIYCDFSGYSDMAIGAAKCLGYDLCRNFNIPYISANITEFWRRWHISLSTWLKDYLYIPLGGNRKGYIRMLVNLTITMLLGGLWHGASWNFVIWGGLHGVALVIHKCILTYRKKMNITAKKNGISVIISTLFTYAFVCICWVFFRSDTINEAFFVIKRMFVWTSVGINQMNIYAIIGIIIVYAANIFAMAGNSREGFYPILNLDKFANKVILMMLLLIILCFCYTGISPFIYFKF